MEECFKAHGKYWGGVSGLEYPKNEVQEVNGQYWHCHGVGQPVIEVGEIEGDTRVHGGYPGVKD